MAEMIGKRRKSLKTKAFGVVFGAPVGIRIPDLPLRRRTLYPTELLAHIAFRAIAHRLGNALGFPAGRDARSGCAVKADHGFYYATKAVKSQEIRRKNARSAAGRAC